MKDFSTKRGVKYLVLAHLIFVVKYRKKLLVQYGLEIKAKMIEISKCNDFEIDYINSQG